MGDGGVRRQNRRFHWRSIAVGEHSIQIDLNDVSEIQLNFIVSQGVERFLRLGLDVSDYGYDSVNRRFIQ
jgi:hypothetical protein